MSNPSQTPTSALPADRLNQIAIRKLSALSVVVQLDSDQKTLRGELTFKLGKIAHPGTRAPIPGAKFAVLGHDHLRFSGSPLAGLGPIKFYEAASLAALEEAIAALMTQRMATLIALAEKLTKFRIAHRLDADRLQVVGAVKAAPHAFEVRGGPEGLWVSKIIPASGPPRDLPDGASLLNLTLFQTPVDLEIHLTEELPTLLQQASAAAAPRVVAAPPPSPSEPVLKATPPVAGAVTLAVLAQKLGGEAMLGQGAPGEVTQHFTLGKLAYRFSATLISGTTFKGSLTGAGSEKWTDKFDLLRFSGIQPVVASVLGVKPPSSEAEEPPPARAASAPDVPSHLIPQLGEVWVMNVIIEREEQDEVRYACTNIDGKPFGATRLLKANEFREVFVQSGPGWRLLILMEEIGADNTVVYRQLDSQRKPRGAPKRIATSILVTNFVPEATAY